PIIFCPFSPPRVCSASSWLRPRYDSPLLRFSPRFRAVVGDREPRSMERPLLSESLAQVTFDDAAIYFSEEQWQNLEDVQKKIYKDLIKEIYETMLALGYRIPKPEIVSRIERGEEPCVDPCKKPKLQESQPEGAPDGSKGDGTLYFI
ncbi:hypothetical protein GDO81_023779, partial [Engystomops pustulosus]